VLDDLGREAMAAVAERAHTDILSDTPLASDPVSVTMPRHLLSRRHRGPDELGSISSQRVPLSCREMQLKASK